MKIDEYITHLRSKGILITVQGDKLAIDAPDEALTREIVEELKVQKPAILSFFNAIKEKTDVTLSIPKASEKDYYPLSSAQQ